MKPTPGVLTKADIARIYGVSRTTAGKWVQRADFPKPMSTGPRPLWNAKKVAAWHAARPVYVPKPGIIRHRREKVEEKEEGWVNKIPWSG